MSAPLTAEAPGLCYALPFRGGWLSWAAVVLTLVAVGRQAQGLPKRNHLLLLCDSLKQKFTAFMMSLIHAFSDITVFDYVH